MTTILVTCVSIMAVIHLATSDPRDIPLYLMLAGAVFAALAYLP
jgi:hypothetical protein